MALTLKKCGYSAAVAHLGGLQCDEKQVLGYILLDKSVLIDPSTFDKDAMDLLIQAGKWIGTLTFESAEDSNSDPSMTETTSLDRIKNNQGRKGWNFTHFKNACFQNELNKLDRSDRFGILLVFEDGTILGEKTKAGMLKAFNARLFTGIKNVKLGAEGGGSVLMVDIARSSMNAWQGSSSSYESDDIDFLNVEPIIGLDIQVPNLVAGATTNVVKITTACSDAPVSGLKTTNLRMRRNGTLQAITSVTEVNGSYSLTHAALVANDVITFETYSAGHEIVVLDTNYYSGVSDEKTVV